VKLPRNGMSPRWRMSRAYALVLAVPIVAALVILASGVNVSAFRALQDASRVVPQALFAPFWQSATYAGDGLAVFALATALLLQRPHAAWAGIVAAVPGSLLLNGLKALLPYDRPALVLMNDGVTVLGPALHHGSFPSGHSVAAGILGGIVFLAYRHWAVRALGVAVALLIGISRAAVGVHWPLDIAVGLALGWLCAWIGWQLVADAPWARTPQARIVGALILGACAIGLWFHPMQLPAATPFRIALAITGLLLALLALRIGVRDWRAARHTASAAVEGESGSDA
jgi:membrane-associated phospholipid phosphatase